MIKDQTGDKETLFVHYLHSLRAICLKMPNRTQVHLRDTCIMLINIGIHSPLITSILRFICLANIKLWTLVHHKEMVPLLVNGYMKNLYSASPSVARGHGFCSILLRAAASSCHLRQTRDVDDCSNPDIYRDIQFGFTRSKVRGKTDKVMYCPLFQK
jgi:hypothetical protein